MRRCILLLAVCFSFLVLGLNGQDARFSQFYAAPLQVNPAMTGLFEGQFRVGLNYRNQWSSVLEKSAFNTYGASFDYKMNVFRHDYIAFGVNFLRDDAGDARFNQTKANLSLSFMKQLSGGRYSRTSQFLIAGIQGGIGQNGINWSQLSFSSQFNNAIEEFVPTDPTGESFGSGSRMYVDASAGLMYYAVFDEDLSIYAGGALHHLNSPGISFYDGSTDPLYMRIVGQMGGEVPFNEQFSILPAAILMFQGPSFETNLGANFRYNNGDRNEVAIRVGGWYRLTKSINGDNTGITAASESIIVSTMLEVERFLIGLSYDVNISTLKQASNSRGAFEVSFIYVHPEDKRSWMKCPKF